MYRIDPRPLKPIHDWVRSYARAWNERFDVLDEVLEELKEKERGDHDNGE